MLHGTAKTYFEEGGLKLGQKRLKLGADLTDEPLQRLENGDLDLPCEPVRDDTDQGARDLDEAVGLAIGIARYL